MPRWSWIALVAHLLADAGGYRVTWGRVGVPRCVGRWPRFRLGGFDEPLLFASNISRLHQGQRHWRCHCSNKPQFQKSLDSGVEERGQYFHARGICSREAAGLLQWVFSKKVARKMKASRRNRDPEEAGCDLGQRMVHLEEVDGWLLDRQTEVSTDTAWGFQLLFCTKACSHIKRMWGKSRLVVRGDLRHASKLRTDSPIWSTRPPNSACCSPFLLVKS